jgi:hypothetical protein
VVAHHSGRSPGRLGRRGVMLRVLALLPDVAFIGFAVSSGLTGWWPGIVVGAVGGVSWLPVTVSAWEGRYDG